MKWLTDDTDFFLLAWLSLIERSQWLTDDTDSLRENADEHGFFLVFVRLSGVEAP